MTISVAELQPILHDLFHDTAKLLATDTGFCRRQRKLTGPVFAQTLVFTLLENPTATLADFAEAAQRHFGLTLSEQALDQRFTEPAACFFQELFLEAFNRSFESAPALLPFLGRFNGVYLRDATLVGLPACLAGHFPGRGGLHAPDGGAAAKLVFEAEITTGLLTDVSLVAGLDNDKTAEVTDKPLPAGALLLEDMGFLSGERMQHYIDQEVIVVSRIPVWTALFDKKSRRIDLLKELRKVTRDSYERDVRLFHATKVSVRLLAVRVPEAEAARRRARVRKEAKGHGRPVSQRKLDMCDWNILVTNAPAALLGAEQACVVRRVRWQIELLFKVFKSEGKIDESRSQQGWRVLCELYAKLLAMVVQHWALLAAGYEALRHSGQRAARWVRKVAGELRAGLTQRAALTGTLEVLGTILRRCCKIARRKKTPSTLDRLMAIDPTFELPKDPKKR